MINEINTKFNLPRISRNSKSGRITVMDGKFYGRSFSTQKAFDSFFAGQAAKKHKETVEMSKMYNDAFKRRGV